jgi:hypothetical protein
LRELILHIGAHKTGSTSIQGFLNRHKGDLAERDWELIAMGGALNLGNIISWGERKNGDIVYSFRDNALENLGRNLEAACHNCIISAEDFFFINDVKAIESLKNILSSYFESIKVLVYLRRQDGMAISQKAQGAKTIQSAKIFGNSPFPLPELGKGVMEYLEYDRKIENWSDYFGKDNLIVRVYERPKLINGDAVTDFIASSGIPITAEPLVLNESLGEQSTLFLHLLRYSGVPHSVIWPLLKSRRIEMSGGERSLPSRAEAQAFQSNFDVSNKKLFDMLNLSEGFDESFDQYPSMSTLPAIDFSFAERNLRIIVSILEEVVNDHSMTLFRATSEKLKQSDPDLADSLQDLLEKFGPCKGETSSPDRHGDWPAAGGGPQENVHASREDSLIISQYIGQINQLARVANDDNVSLFMKIAEALDDTDPQAAEDFVAMAKSIRPYGTHIKRKIAQYARNRKGAEEAARNAKLGVRAKKWIRRRRSDFLSVFTSDNPWRELSLLLRRIKSKLFR